MPDPTFLRPTEETLFAEALALPPEQRRAFVAQRCDSNSIEAERVLALLDGYQAKSAFLDRPAPASILQSGGIATLQVRPEPAPGDSIGRYRLLERIGEGGFGIVYVAEQREPVRRRVALKLMRLGMDSREFVARFEAERQALALMDHPNIARVFDAGATEPGRPYLVMELVRGLPITKYCDEHRLNLKERIELFIAVCGAIQHAHQKGVIHRDLKPSNILVAREAGTPVPKVIDFGIAKAVAGPLTDKTLFTVHHTLMGTPAYASPEQMEFGAHDVDTRSDLYSLGALLYELLTGSPPFERAVLERAGFDEMRRMIREVEPVRPSVRVSALSEEETRAGRPCYSALRSDLDWIVMRCLEKDRTRRYETTGALAADIRRHLNHEPVVARPPSQSYRLRKYFQRHRTPVIAAAAVAVSLVGGLVATGLLLVREKAAAEKSRQVAQFMKDMLGGVGPSVARGRDTTLLREVLDATIARLDTDLRGQPEVAADLRHTLGVALREIGEYDRAVALWREAITARRALGDERSRELAATLHELGSLLAQINQVEEAESALEEAREIRRRTLGPEHFDVGTTLAALADNRGSLRSAAARLALVGEAVAIQRKLPGHNDDEFAKTLMTQGYLWSTNNQHAEADGALRESVGILRRLHGDAHPRLAEALGRWAYQIRMMGGWNPEELQLRRQALRIVREVRGLANAKLVAALLDFATCRFPPETWSEDLRLAREVLADLRGVLPAESPDLAVAQLAFASLLDLEPGNAAEVEALTRESVVRLRAARAAGHSPHSDTSVAMQNLMLRLHEDARLRLARPVAEELHADKKFGAVLKYGPPSARLLGYIYYDLGLYAEALPLLEQNVLDHQNRTLWRPVRRAHLLVDYCFWGDMLRRLGRLDESRQVLERGLRRKFDEDEASDPAQRARAAVRGELGLTVLAEGKPEEAEKWFREALPDYDAAPVVNRWSDLRPRGRIAMGLGQALAAQGKVAYAEKWIVEGYSELMAKRRDGTFWGDPTILLREAHEAVVKFYRESGQPEKAAKWEAERPAL